MSFRYHSPLDPECPGNPQNRPHDPMDDYCGCMDEINEALDNKHRRNCRRCQEYGTANIEVTDG
jgi:hypothetical protein